MSVLDYLLCNLTNWLLIENGDITQEEHDNALKRQRVDRLTCSPVFSMLEKTELVAISSRFVEITVPAGRQFIIQDEPDPTLYIIASGKVEVYRTNLDGSHLYIAYVETYEHIGEMGYFQGGVLPGQLSLQIGCYLRPVHRYFPCWKKLSWLQLAADL